MKETLWARRVLHPISTARKQEARNRIRGPITLNYKRIRGRCVEILSNGVERRPEGCPCVFYAHDLTSSVSVGCGGALESGGAWGGVSESHAPPDSSRSSMIRSFPCKW